ncbi:ras-related protein Rab-38b isoform X2 [Rhinichthys klamathensis goyatoka]|uniref:ras-related protein Rab-38b isoform X2 n=1 Tax=Rhinichthys klamathensis goyatoka TaxID=3034132 RepID=UPI0024B51AA9|nr:ras-related protein Rab-38b isoform X2 [Rhinichthys klamathensis goyatoka]
MCIRRTPQTTERLSGWILRSKFSTGTQRRSGCSCGTSQERFGNMTRVYYREAMGAFIVFDVTRPTTFEAVSKWKEDLDSKLILSNGQSVATVLLANKCDQNRDFLTNNGLKMDQYCKENGFVGWFETSAKENLNINDAANFLVKHIIASENDILKSVVPDTISPQLNSGKEMTCSACFKP